MNKARNILRISAKEMASFRDFKQLIFMLVTPIGLILILGTMLTNAFNPSAAVGDIRVLYKMNSGNSELTNYWDAFVEGSGPSGILFEEAADGTNGKLEVENNRYVGYVEIADSGLDYYGNSRSRIESDIAQGALAGFSDRYKLASAIAQEDPEQAAAMMSGEGGSEEHVQAASLNAAKQPSSMDYYAIAMTTLIILYGALTAASLIDTERKQNTAVRLMAAPITKGEIFAGKIVGNILQNAIYVGIVVLICKYVFHVNWGGNLGLVFLILLSQIVFALSLGIGFSYLFKGNAAGTMVMIIIQVGAFFGGSYFPLQDVTGILKALTYYSPLEWTNEALLQLIYADNGSAAVEAMALNIGFSVLLLGAAILIMRRREGL